MRHDLERDSWPSVGHENLSIASFSFCTNGDQSAVWRMAERIRDEIFNASFEKVFFYPYRSNSRYDPEIELNTFTVRFELKIFNQLSEYGVEGNGRELPFDTTLQ